MYKPRFVLTTCQIKPQSGIDYVNDRHKEGYECERETPYALLIVINTTPV